MVRDSRREWRLITLPYALQHFANDIVLGELPMRTGRLSEVQRSIDGIVIRRRGRGDRVAPVHLHDARGEAAYWKKQLRGADVIVLQSKVQRLGFSVLGQTLMSALVVRDSFGAARATGIALATEVPVDLRELLELEPYNAIMQADVVEQPERAKARREDRPEPTLLARVAFPRYVVMNNVPASSDETVEALLIRADGTLESVDDITGRDAVVVHTSRRTHLSNLGHVVFGAEMIALRYKPASVRSLLLVRQDDPVLSRPLQELLRSQNRITVEIREV